MSVNVFNTKAIFEDTIFTSPSEDGNAILRGHPSHAKVQPFSRQLHFSVTSVLPVIVVVVVVVLMSCCFVLFFVFFVESITMILNFLPLGLH